MNEMIPATRARTVRLAAVAVCIALLAACTGDDGGADPGPTGTVGPPASSMSESASPTPSPSPSPSPTPSPTPSDSFAVPDEITPQYVERVLNEIHRVDAVSARAALQRPLDEGATELPASDRALLESVYEEPQLTARIRETIDLVRSEEARNGLLPPDQIDQLRTSVDEVLATEPCVIARGRTDLTGIDADVQREEPLLSFYFLVRAEDAGPTGWRFALQLDGVSGDQPVPEDELLALTAEDLRAQYPEVCS